MNQNSISFISVHFSNWILAILVQFGSFRSFASFGSLVNVLIAILDHFTIKKSRKYFIETKTLIKISFVYKIYSEVLEK